MRRSHPLFALVAALLSIGRPASAEVPTRSEKAVVEARRLIKVELRYAEAIELLEPALRDLDLSTPDRIEAYELLAQALVAKGAIEKAEAAFSSLLDLSPDHILSAAVSPKIREVFERVRRRRQKAPKLVDVSVSVAAHQLTFAGTLDDPASRVSGVELYVRESGDVTFRETPMQLDGRALSAVLDGEIKGGARVDYYVIARGERGESLAHVGGPDNPSSVFVEGAPAIAPPAQVVVESPDEEKKPRSLVAEWWFWTAIGVVVVAGATAVFFALRPVSHDPNGTLQPIHVP